jgi:hypothetical protein
MDRVRERGIVLIVLTEPRAPWPLPADLSFHLVSSRWIMSSHLDARYVTLRVSGRGEAQHRGEHVVMVPDVRGRAVAR